MRTPKRRLNEWNTKKGATRRFYLPNGLYDRLVEEAERLGIPISRALRRKLELLDNIVMLVFGYLGKEEKKIK